MSTVPINAVSSRGWPLLYPQARQLRVRQDLSSDEEQFTIALEMPGGEVRYLINNQDEVRIFDSRQLAAFLRKHTREVGFDVIVKPVRRLS